MLTYNLVNYVHDPLFVRVSINHTTTMMIRVLSRALSEIISVRIDQRF